MHNLCVFTFFMFCYDSALPRAPHRVWSVYGLHCTRFFSPDGFRGIQEKYLLSFKNILENFHIEEKMYHFREVKDLWVGGVGL